MGIPRRGPPSYVYVLETCTANGLSGSPGAGPSASANNGLGSHVVTTVNQIAPTYNQTSVSCKGTRITYQNLGGSGAFTVTCSPVASGALGCGVQYSAVITAKALTINSSVDITYHKGPDGLPVSNSTSVLSPKYGDTWVNPYNAWYFVNPTFTSDPVGMWSNNLYHAWNAAGEPFTDSLLSTYTSITPTTWNLTAAQLTQMGISGPVTYEVDLTLTDNGQGGISVPAVYYMRAHNPYDDWINTGTLPDIYEGVTINIAKPGSCTRGTGIACTWTEDDIWWSALSSANTLLTPVLSSVCENPLYDGLFAAAGIGLTQVLPLPSNAAAMFDSLWGFATADGKVKSTISGSWTDDPQPYSMTPELDIEYILITQTADTYGPNGYTGLTPNILAKKKAYVWYGNYTRTA